MPTVNQSKSIKVRPSVIGYIAKSVALIGGGKKQEGCRVCDLAFRHCHQNDVDLLLLTKAVVMFMAGEHDDAVSRVGDLIATVHLNSTCHVAYMYLLLGNSQMESGDYEGAIQSFLRARAHPRDHTGRLLLMISLVSGWKFGSLAITIRQRLCEALYVASRTKEAGESLLEMVNVFDREVYMSETVTKWVSDFTQRCLSAPESSDDAASKAPRHNRAQTLYATPHSLTPPPLLREWAKATLSSGSWKDALVASVSLMVPRSAVFRAVCEYLETIDHIMDASECFHQIVDELAGQTTVHDKQAEWVLGE
ncbi:hypothetical protein J3R83DRAFT_7149 [Lanmaoa asiatica]|nr:hypothetical protein J3R83DRAFT_7149 [Lanmaoa asiatica]